MIVKNEEQVLARCLDCAKQFADEIIIVDTGSSDKTMEIARRYTDKVFEFAWIDDFSAARNFSFSRATKDYMMWLDADDIIDEENIGKLLALKESIEPEVDVAMMQYQVAFDSAGNPTFSYFRERLVRRAGGYIWQEPVYEHIVIHGTTRQYEIAIRHGEKERTHSTRNLDIYEKRKRKNLPFSPRARYYYARELRTHGRDEDAIREYREFLAIPGIWVEDAIWAASDLSDCLIRKERESEALDTLFLSFNRDLPRAEILCRIGQIYMNRGDSAKAVFWYGFALEVPKPQGWGFLSESHWGYIPHMQLCVLHDRMGDRDKALLHHEAARTIRPDDPGVLYNDRYFYGKG